MDSPETPSAPSAQMIEAASRYFLTEESDRWDWETAPANVRNAVRAICTGILTAAAAIGEARTSELESALTTIAADSCEHTHNRVGACVHDASRVYPSNPTVNGTYEEMCAACVAWGALYDPDAVKFKREKRDAARAALGAESKPT